MIPFCGAHFRAHRASTGPRTRPGWCTAVGTQLRASSSGTVGATMREASSLREVVQQYEGLLLDQFGVLHDGRKPYPGAMEAVKQLHASGKQLLIISNSSRRSGGTIAKLAKMGFSEECFAGAITSGELAHRYLQSRPTSWWQQLGRRCLHITWSSRGTISLAGLGLEVVMKPEEADFILAHGTQGLGQPDGSTVEYSLEQLQEVLTRCAELGSRPMVVANPDLVTVDGEGLITMPGTLARHYQQQGGQVQLMGKPDPIVYQAALEMQPGISKAGWLAVGDSLEHDIAGASAAGIDSAFIVSGIHAKDCNFKNSSDGSSSSSSNGSSQGPGTWDDAELGRLLQEHGVTPSYVLGRMLW